jgi:hypothetical protein
MFWSMQLLVLKVGLGLIILVNTIFVTSKRFSVSDIIFYTELKYVLSFSISHKVFKGHTVII